MRTRLLTSFEIVVVLALAFILKAFVSDYFFDALIVFIAVFATLEASRMFTKMGKYNFTYMACASPFVFLFINLIGVSFDSTIGITFTVLLDIAAMAIGFGVAFLISIFAKKKTITEMKIRKLDKEMTLGKFSINKAFNTTVAFVYPSFLIMLMVFINHFDALSTSYIGTSKFGGYLSLTALIFLFLIPIFTDTFAYITGGLIGGKKLCPKVSPKKTISGAVGGVLWCVFLCTACYFILNAIEPIGAAFAEAGFAVWKLILISLFGSVVCQCGDLFESFLKRHAGIKDSGRLLPGHGGMLDRFDSYIFLVPIILLAFSFMVLAV